MICVYMLHKNYKSEHSIMENIIKFKPDLLNNKAEFNKVYKELLFAKYIYGVTYLDEYFLFDLQNRTDEERKNFVGTDEYLRATKKLKTKIIADNPTLKDKYTAYITLKPFYKRDAVCIKSESDYEAFEKFAEKHPVFILKKLTGSLGKNIRKVDMLTEDLIAADVFNYYLSKGNWIAEEIISQSESMAQFHHESVNTVRIATYVDGEEVKKLFSMFRMGSGDNVVDNASNGGICASVDLSTGIVESNGYKKNGDIIETHPDSAIKIKGFQIPCWDELMNLVEQVATQVPYYKYIGWDFALTDNGWVVVEGNSRPNVNSIQMCSGKGLRKILDETIGLK